MKLGITKSRICLMMKYYCTIVFDRDQDNFKALTKFLFESLIEPPYQAVAKQVYIFLFIFLKNCLGIRHSFCHYCS